MIGLRPLACLGVGTTSTAPRFQFLLRALMNLPSTPTSAGQTAAVHLERTAGSARNKDVLDAVVESTEQLSPTVRGLTLRLDKDADSSPSFLAGQWIDLFVPSLDVVGGFSIHSPPHLLACQGRIGLAVKTSPHKHPPAEWVHNQCKNGDQVQLRFGGDFHHDPAVDRESSLLLIAGGVGINPLKSILEETLWHDAGGGVRRPIRLLYSSKLDEELLFREQLEALSSNHSQFDLQLFVTDSKPTDDACEHRQIDKSVVQASLNSLSHPPSHDSPKCFICGPPPMIDAISQTLLDLDLSEKQIFFEKWW